MDLFRMFGARQRNLLRELRAEIDAAIRKAESNAPIKRLEALEIALCELRDLHEELHRSHVKLRARQGMREARAKLNGGDDPVRAQTDALVELERKHGLRK